MPSALLAANTAPSVAHRPTSLRQPGSSGHRPVSGLMRQTWPCESETQTACFPAVNATGYLDGHLGRGCVRVRLDAQSLLGGRHHRASPSARPTGTWPTSMIARTRSSSGRCGAWRGPRRSRRNRHRRRPRRSVPDEFARAPRSIVSTAASRWDRCARPVPSLPFATDRIGGDSEVYRRCSIPIVLMTSRRSDGCETVPSSALATQTEPCPIARRQAFGPRARGPRPGSAAGRSQRPSREEPRLSTRRRSATLVRQRVVDPGDYRRLERRIVVEDGSLEALELIVRLEPELLVQQPPARAVDLERVCLAATQR